MKDQIYKPIFESALFDAENFMSLDIPKKNKILNPWLSEQSIILISGWRGTGKTWFGLSIFDSISRGQSFGPWPTEAPVPSLYIDGEMNAADVQDRLLTLNNGCRGRRRAPLFIYSDAYANSLGIPRANLRSERWRSELKKVLIDRKIRLVGFDNIASLAAGIDENVKQAWDPINSWLLDLRFSGISSVLFHHTNKEGDQRGTSAREDNIDISIMLFQPHNYTPDQGARFIVRFKKSRIKTDELHLLQDYEFSLIENDGHVEWSYSNPKRRNKEEIIRLLDEAIPQVDIAKILNVTKQFVSKTKEQAVRDGILSSKGKLIQGGSTVKEGENLVD
jgi:putative DNA primase/helicase